MIGNVFSKAGDPPRIASLSAMGHQLSDQLLDDLAARRWLEGEELPRERDIRNRVVGDEVRLFLELDLCARDRFRDHRGEFGNTNPLSGADVDDLVHYVAELISSEAMNGLACDGSLNITVDDTSIARP